MARQGERRQRFRALLLLAVFIVGFGLLLTRCPSKQGWDAGPAGSGHGGDVVGCPQPVLALDLWTQQRSTAQLTSVQLSDARDEVVKAYKGIADLKAEDPVDIERQRMLTESMTKIIGQLNAASATLRQVTTEPTVRAVRGDLLASVDALETGYR